MIGARDGDSWAVSASPYSMPHSSGSRTDGDTPNIQDYFSGSRLEMIKRLREALLHAGRTVQVILMAELPLEQPPRFYRDQMRCPLPLRHTRSMSGDPIRKGPRAPSQPPRTAPAGFYRNTWSSSSGCKHSWTGSVPTAMALWASLGAVACIMAAGIPAWMFYVLY